MNRSAVARIALSFPAALLLSMTLAGPSLAATWSGPVPIGPNRGSYVHLGDICAVRGDAVAVFTDFDDVIVKRSTDEGATWRRSVIYRDEDAFLPELACRGSRVDVAWEGDYHARYARSVDNGISFSRAVRLSPVLDDVGDVDVARGSGSTVAVVWDDTDLDDWPDFPVRIRVRVSRDGGTTFGRATTVSSGFAPAIAFGDGVIYLAFLSDDDNEHILLRRSLDFGATWTPPVTLTTKAAGLPSIAADGDHVYVAYARADSSKHWAVYRRSTDWGRTWSTPIRLSRRFGHQITYVDMSVDAGVTRAVFAVSGGGLNPRIRYRESADGLTWSPAETVANGDAPRVTFTGRTLVGYSAAKPDGTGTRSYLRYRTP